MATANITIRMDSQLKKQGEELFSDMGLSMTAAITAFVKQAVREQGFPFKLTRNFDSKIDSRAVRAVKEIEEMERNPEKYKSYSSAKEMLEDIL